MDTIYNAIFNGFPYFFGLSIIFALGSISKYVIQCAKVVETR